MTRLFDQGCQLMQGFLFSPAVPGDDFPSMLKARPVSRTGASISVRARVTRALPMTRQFRRAFQRPALRLSGERSCGATAPQPGQQSPHAKPSRPASSRIKRTSAALAIGSSAATVKLVVQQRLTQLLRLRRRPLNGDHCGTHTKRRAWNSLRSDKPSLKDPLPLRSSGDDKRRASAQPLLSWHCVARDVFSFTHQARLSDAQALGGAALPSGRRPRSGETPGQLSKKSFSFLRRRCETQVGTLVPDAQAGPRRPTLARRDEAALFD